jgi:hypothetical protein
MVEEAALYGWLNHTAVYLLGVDGVCDRAINGARDAQPHHW